MKKSVLITRYSSSWIRKVYGIFLVVIIVGVVPAAFADSPCLSLSRAVNDSVYKAGQEILVTLTLQNNCTHTITSLGITETLPEGWQFISGEVINGAAPVQWPESGSMDPLEIFWITVPELPLSLWYTVKTPDTAIDPAFFSGHAIFSFAAGNQQNSAVAETTLMPFGMNTEEGETEGEVVHEGEQIEGETEGESRAEGEGEVVHEGEQNEGETEGESRVEGEGEEDIPAGCCRRHPEQKTLPVSHVPKQHVGDGLLFIGSLFIFVVTKMQG